MGGGAPQRRGLVAQPPDRAHDVAAARAVKNIAAMSDPMTTSKMRSLTSYSACSAKVDWETVTAPAMPFPDRIGSATLSVSER
jgi:hypothetical protein